LSQSQKRLQRKRAVRTFPILLFVFVFVFLLVDLGFYVKEPINGGAFVAALVEESVSWAEHSYRTAAYLLPFVSTVRPIIISVVLFIVIVIFPLIFFFLFLLLVPFFSPSTFLVLFAVGVTERTSLPISLLSIVPCTRK
jgi:hypothetical protein